MPSRLKLRLSCSLATASAATFVRRFKQRGSQSSADKLTPIRSGGAQIVRHISDAVEPPTQPSTVSHPSPAAFSMPPINAIKHSRREPQHSDAHHIPLSLVIHYSSTRPLDSSFHTQNLGLQAQEVYPVDEIDADEDDADADSLGDLLDRLESVAHQVAFLDKPAPHLPKVATPTRRSNKAPNEANWLSSPLSSTSKALPRAQLSSSTDDVTRALTYPSTLVKEPSHKGAFSPARPFLNHGAHYTQDTVEHALKLRKGEMRWTVLNQILGYEPAHRNSMSSASSFSIKTFESANSSGDEPVRRAYATRSDSWVVTRDAVKYFDKMAARRNSLHKLTVVYHQHELERELGIKKKSNAENWAALECMLGYQPEKITGVKRIRHDAARLFWAKPTLVFGRQAAKN